MEDQLERFLVLTFLRRYITYCARRRRFAAMNGAARLLFAEVIAMAKASPVKLSTLPIICGAMPAHDPRAHRAPSARQREMPALRPADQTDARVRRCDSGAQVGRRP